MKPTPTPIKHLRKREETEPGHITRYYAACGKNGTAGRDYPKDINFVTCPQCAARVPRSRLQGQTYNAR